MTMKKMLPILALIFLTATIAVAGAIRTQLALDDELGFQGKEEEQKPQEKTSALEVGEIVASMALSNDSKWLVTGSWEGAIRLWDLSTGKQVRTFKGHAGIITAVALSNDCKKLVTTGVDGTARLWDVASGKEKR